LKKRRRADEDDEEYDRPAAARPWWWSVLLRRPRDTLAGIVAAGAAIAIIVNGVYMQHGPHPAPIFAIKPLPVAPSRESVGSVPRPHAAAQDAGPRELASAPAQPIPVAVELPRPRPVNAPAAPGARKDPIAELLAGHILQTSPPTRAQPAHQAAAPMHQAALPAAPAAPPAPPAPTPPAPIPAPSRSLAQPSRQVLAVQRALSEFGYGQIKPTGVMDDETRTALKQFQGTHNMQVTGELNDQVRRELASMVGHELN
jgi:peptidoglycan hydrolase-like protein with peptidoglycan-binding domain